MTSGDSEFDVLRKTILRGQARRRGRPSHAAPASCDLARFVLELEGPEGLAGEVANARLRLSRGDRYGEYYAGLIDGLDYTLRVIGAFYAHHPDYREEWRP